MSNPSSHETLFEATQWSVVSNAAHGGDAVAAEALEALFTAYWQPLYRYLRRVGHSEQDAKDLVQGFLAHLLEHDGLKLADRTKGRFRAFLLGSLKNYATNQWRKDHALKRGGFAAHLSLDWKSAETGLGIELSDPMTPDLLYDRDWAIALLSRVLDDMERMEKDLSRWKPFLSVNSTTISYAEIAREFQINEGAARIAVHRLRKLYRKLLRQEIARTLTSDELVEDEMRSLFCVLAG